MQHRFKTPLGALLVAGFASLALAQAPAPQPAAPPASVMIENVRIFNGTADQAVGPVERAGDRQRDHGRFPPQPIASPEGASVTRIAGWRAHADARADRQPCAPLHGGQFAGAR